MADDQIGFAFYGFFEERERSVNTNTYASNFTNILNL